MLLVSADVKCERDYPIHKQKLSRMKIETASVFNYTYLPLWTADDA